MKRQCENFMGMRPSHPFCPVRLFYYAWASNFVIVKETKQGEEAEKYFYS